MLDVNLETYTVTKKGTFIGIPIYKTVKTKNVKITEYEMKHNIKLKTEVLNLLNSGLNAKEVFTKTGVTEKTISKWVKKWLEIDKPKKDILTDLWKKMQEQSKAEKLNDTEIKQITQSIQKLQGELFIFGKYINI